MNADQGHTYFRFYSENHTKNIFHTSPLPFYDLVLDIIWKTIQKMYLTLHVCPCMPLQRQMNVTDSSMGLCCLHFTIQLLTTQFRAMTCIHDVLFSDSGENVVLPSEDSDTEEGEPEELSTALDMKVLVTSKGEIKLFDAESNKKVWQSGSSLEPQPKRRRIALPLSGKRKGEKQRKVKQEQRNKADTMKKSVALGKKPAAKVMKKQPAAKGLKKGSTAGKGTKKVPAEKVIVKKVKKEQQ